MPMKGIFGNNDGDKFRHLKYSQDLNLDVTYEDRFLELIIDNRKIAVFMETTKKMFRHLSLVIFMYAVFHGHTHKKVYETRRKYPFFKSGFLDADDTR